MTEQGSAWGGSAELAADVERWLLGLAGDGAPRGRDARDRAARLVAALDHPQRAAPAVHVVGTAGKGTVVGLLSAMATGAGRSVATHQSPHVADIRERFLVNGAFPSDDALVAAFAAVRVGVDEVRRVAGGPPSFFAATAALSWVLGRDHGVDLFVTEAGIGGRLDATAVLDRSDTLTVITAIGLDHTEVLGPTVADIAGEKAAVLEGRTRAVLGPQPDADARRVVRDRARRFGTELVEVEAAGDWRADARATAGVVATLLDLDADPAGAPLPPGRLEVREIAGRRLVLDGAHNPMKLAALVETLDGEEPPAVALVAIGSAKDLPGCAAALARLGCPIVVTEFGGVEPPHSLPADAVVGALTASGVDAVAAPDLHGAAREARVRSGEGEIVLVTGSFLVLEDAAAALA